MFSTNAKDIGTLYLIFAIFAGISINVYTLAIEDALVQLTVIPVVTTAGKQTKGQLGPYLAGLIESDGAIMTPTTPGNTPTIKITFSLRDLPLAHKLLDVLGFGSIQPCASSANAVDFIVRSTRGIYALVDLTNGYYRTPKISAFYTLID